MLRRRGSTVFSDPRLVGAIAIIVLTFGTVVTYNLSDGLPFVPKYNLHVQVPNAGQITKGAEVTIAGDRVGQVVSVHATARQGKAPIATIDLTIDKKYEPLPADTTVLVRPSGSLGRKFVALSLGKSSAKLGDGATLPISQAKPAAVELDQVLNTFQAPVRRGAQRSLDGLGVGFTGRGQDVNLAIQEFAPLLAELDPVMRSLADPRNGLGRFTRALSDLAGELSPLSGQTAGLFVDLNTTFRGLAGVSSPYLEEAISETPPTLDAATAAFTRTTPFLRETTSLLRELRPGARRLVTAAPVLASAFRAGAANLPAVSGLSRRLASAVDGLADFAQRPAVRGGVQRIALSASALRLPVAWLTPTETNCGYISIFMRNLASVFKEGLASGTTVRASGVVVGVDKNSERGPSNQPYRGRVAKALGPVHTNPYPNSTAPGQTFECEAGREPYVNNQAVIGNVPGNQGLKTESAAKLP